MSSSRVSRPPLTDGVRPGVWPDLFREVLQVRQVEAILDLVLVTWLRDVHQNKFGDPGRPVAGELALDGHQPHVG